MIVGNIYKKCVTCGTSKPLEAFELDVVDDNDPYIKNHSCNDCYQLRMVEAREFEAGIKKSILIDKRVNFIYKKPETYPHARMCPKCTSKTGCGCYDTDPDGYR